MERRSDVVPSTVSSRLRDVRRVPSTQWGVEGAVDILRPVSRTSSTVPCGRHCCGEVGLLASRRRRGTAVRTGSGCSRGCSSPPPPNGPWRRRAGLSRPRGWRSLITVPAAGVDVEVVVGGVEYTFTSDRGGYVHGEIRATLAPGWHEVTVAVAGRAPVAARLRVVDDRTARVSSATSTTRSLSPGCPDRCAPRGTRSSSANTPAARSPA